MCNIVFHEVFFCFILLLLFHVQSSYLSWLSLLTIKERNEKNKHLKLLYILALYYNLVYLEYYYNNTILWQCVLSYMSPYVSCILCVCVCVHIRVSSFVRSSVCPLFLYLSLSLSSLLLSSLYPPLQSLVFVCVCVCICPLSITQ